MKNVLITDLDRTIIHSKNPSFTCVEKYNGREITFMTDKAIEILDDLLSRKDFVFVPCTMRKFHQTMRVDFISEYKPKYMICENGAQIYVDGELDEEWEAHMRTIVNPSKVENGIEKIKSLNFNFRDLLNIDGFYIAISFHNENDANDAYESIASMFENPFNTIQVGRKIFVIHNMIDKVYAVEYLVKKYNIGRFITSGDSEADERFTTLGDAILPRHASFRHWDAAVTGKTGIYSTEDILNYVKETFYN